jgi:hypothetical protein
VQRLLAADGEVAGGASAILFSLTPACADPWGMKQI